MEESYHAYIIRSEKHGRYYVGMSSDPEKRLFFHNQGLNTSTRNGVPWNKIWQSDPMPKEDAIAKGKDPVCEGQLSILPERDIELCGVGRVIPRFR